MKKTTKGAIAASAAALLLLGGGGTFALWNDAITISGTAVQAGELKLTETGVGVWSTDPAGVDTIANIDNYAIVPGATIYYTLPNVKITAGGNDLYYALVTGFSDAGIAADLDDYFTLTTTLSEVTPTEDNFFPSSGLTPAGTYVSTTPNVTLDAADVYFYNSGTSVTGDAFQFQIKIEFSENTDDLVAQLETISLSTDVNFSLVQVVKA